MLVFGVMNSSCIAGVPTRRSKFAAQLLLMVLHGGANMTHLLRKLWWHDEGQDIAEYAVMLAVILIIVVGTVRLIGSNANNAFSAVASSIH